MNYRKPKKRLHREFLYLDHVTILNSLSALEAGKVDEILQRLTEARDRGLSLSLGIGPVAGGASRTKQSEVEESIVRTRTIFSAFEAWRSYLEEGDALGSMGSWSEDVLGQLEVGDTIEFPAILRVHPLHLVMRTFLTFAEESKRAGSIWHRKGQEQAEIQSNARQMESLVGLKADSAHYPVYMAPLGVTFPRIVSRLMGDFLLSPREGINGKYTVIGQVEEVLSEGETISSLRILRDMPPTPMETSTVGAAMQNFIEPSAALGVEITNADITIPAPAVLLRPIAIFR